MTYRIVTLEPGQRVVLEGRGSNVSAVDDIRFQRTETGTRIDYTADIELTGLLRLASPFAGRRSPSIAATLARECRARSTRWPADLPASRGARTA